MGIWPATIAIKTIDGSRQECGRCFHLAAQTVTVTLNGKTYTGTIANNGKWSVNVGAADLAVLTDGQSYAVTASAVDTLLLTIAYADSNLRTPILVNYPGPAVICGVS